MDITSNFVHISSDYGHPVEYMNISLSNNGWIRGLNKLSGIYSRDPFPYGNMDYLHKVLFF